MPSLSQLRQRIAGAVVTAEDPHYDVARAVDNPRVDRRPRVVVRCATEDDVLEAVRHARADGRPVAVRGGGTHVAGWGTCDDGIVIDLGALKATRLDVAGAVVDLGPGVRWRHLDAVTARAGLAAPGGHGPDVGVVGYTLGGGIGELSRLLGLACDNVEAFSLVDANGRRRWVTADEHPDLFWALRGGGGNFGVVTAVRMRLHAVERIVSGPVLLRAEHAADAVAAARDWVGWAGRHASFVSLLWTAPPAPFVPEMLHFEPCVMLLPTWSGPVEQAEAVIADLDRRLPAPVAHRVAPMPYVEYSTFFARPPGLPVPQEYARGELLNALDDDTVAGLVAGWAAGGPAISLVIGPLGGAIRDVGHLDTAFAHRHASWFVEVNARWRVGADGTGPVGVARDIADALAPVASGPYVNLFPDPAPHRVLAAYGHDHLRRLQAVKRDLDPDNMFRFNANVVGVTDATGSSGAAR